MRKPNILFFQVDQLSARFLRSYGGSVCVAPHLDALAEGGVVFENAYCNFPLCAPSRFSMAAGQLCSAIGAYDNAAEFPAEVPTYAHYLRELGYRTSLSGKMHFIGPDQFHGFERRLTPDLYPADFSWVPNWGNEGKRDTNDARSVTVSGQCERSVQIDFDELVAREAEQHLYDIARDTDERPFFMQVSFTHPHEPYLCQPRYWDLYADDDIPMPTVGPLKDSEYDAHSRRLLADFGMLGVEFAQDDIRRARHAYYGAISYLDTLIGRVLSALTAIGEADNTVVVFTSDHGDLLGERGMWFKKHFFDSASQVPLIVHAPWIAAERIAAPVSLVDLLPTFNALASGSTWDEPVEPLSGNDLTPLLGGRNGGERTVFAEYLAEATPVPMFMVRRGRWKYVHSSVDGPMLFDLLADPRELTNVASEARCSDIAAGFAETVANTWDEPAIDAAIRRSQARRLLLRSAMGRGEPVRWNHGEQPGEPVRWYRGEGGYNAWAFDYVAASPTTLTRARMARPGK